MVGTLELKSPLAAASFSFRLPDALDLLFFFREESSSLVCAYAMIAKCSSVRGLKLWMLINQFHQDLFIR